MTVRRIEPIMITVLVACGDPLLDGSAAGSDAASGSDKDSDSGGTDDTGEPPAVGLPAADGPCRLDPAGSHVLLTTTDFATGALSVVDVEAATVAADVALGTTDGVPFWHASRAYVVHRHMYDFIDVLDPAPNGWSTLGQYPVDATEVASANPYAIAFSPDGRAFVPMFAAAAVAVFDLTQPPSSARIGTVDLSDFMDDGNPEPSVAVGCGSSIWIGVQRLAPGLTTRIGPDALVPIDTERDVAIDLDPDVDGGQGIALLGAGLKQLRRDPRDPDGHTLLALTDGIERVDIGTGDVSWVVPPSLLGEVGVRHHLLPLAFDVDAHGETIYLAAYGREELDCSQVWQTCFEHPARLFRISLTGGDVAGPIEPFADDLGAVGPTLEVVGDRLVFGSNHPGRTGVFLYDVRGTEPTLVAGPLSTGLPPYATTVIDP